jgi:hypothetical protein
MPPGILPPVTSESAVILPFNILLPVIFKEPDVIPWLNVLNPETVIFPYNLWTTSYNNEPVVTPPLNTDAPVTVIELLVKPRIQKRTGL